MRSQKEDLVDRRKVEVWQHMEPKRTKRSIAFLCSDRLVRASETFEYSLDKNHNDLVYLTSNRYSI